MPRECLKIIESKSKVRQSRAKAVVAKVSTSSSTPAISFEVAELNDMVRALLLDKKNQSLAPASSPTTALVKAVEPNCITCSGTHSKACQQALWMKQALIDYGLRLNDIPIMCDNKGAIDLSKNLIQHSRTKHIEIRHHFLCDNVQKGNISIEKVASEDNIADIFTKPLKREVFDYLRLELGMMELIMDSDPSSSQK
nr:copia protein [Tanacetum cinerariifolium]